MILQYFKSFFLVSFIISLFFISDFIHAAEPIPIQVFSREECIHCQAEKEFWEELSLERQDFQVEYLDIDIPENNLLWKEVAEEQNLPKVTPITLIGETIIQGFATSETTGNQMIELIDYYQNNPTTIDSFKSFLESDVNSNVKRADEGVCFDECVVEPEVDLSRINVPFFGSVNLSQLSLPVLAASLGFIDGFNPCAMWVLVTFLLILAQLKSRKKMFVFAGLFIVAEALMYTMILTVWYTTWDFVGLDRIVTPIVGLLGIGGGLFFLYEWKTSKPGECKVTNLSQRQKIRSRIQSVVEKPMTIMSGVSIILIAFSVNVIEFACSIGIPQTFTKIIEINNLHWLYSASLIAVYILMYMVDDFVVFGLALYSFDKIGLTSKYSKLSNLIGGIVLIILGVILITKPELLRVF